MLKADTILYKEYCIFIVCSFKKKDKVTINNLITIKGGSYDDVKKALRQWIDLYSEELEIEISFDLFKNGRGSHIIKVDDRLDNERFYYLVNYLNFPEGIEYKIDIEGFAISLDQKELQNKKILVYISDKDTEGDNVFVVTEDNETFKIDFGGKVTKVIGNKTYKLPDINLLNDPEIIRLNKKEYTKNREEKSKANITKRVKPIILAIFTLFLASYLTFSNINTFLSINSAICFLVWGWLWIDYRLLQVSRHYFEVLGLSMVILIYGYFLSEKYIHLHNAGLVKNGAALPIFFLILQRPLRYTFKAVMKREPVVDTPAPTFADFVYIFILIMTTLIVPTITIK